MSHQELAISFQKSATCIKSKCVKDLSYEEICRAVYNRLYYALFHKYLAYDNELSSSNDRSKHNAVLNKIRDNYSLKTYQLYKKMQSLRIWADYHLSAHPAPGAEKAILGLDILIMQINSTIQKDIFE